jgi:hypothetical protein
MASELFYETPSDKRKAFQNVRLLLLSKKDAVIVSDDAQPLYFYPFSILDFLKDSSIRELHICGTSQSSAIDAIQTMPPGKVHIEGLDRKMVETALERGHKVSLICDARDITEDTFKVASDVHYLRMKVDREGAKNPLLGRIPSAALLSGYKVYISPDTKDYAALISALRDTGFDFVRVSKKLEEGFNPRMHPGLRAELFALKGFDSPDFHVLLPRTLERIFNGRFRIDDAFGNSHNCDFSPNRRVLHSERFYPCYTQVVMDNPSFSVKSLNDKLPESLGTKCSDCACIYENDLMARIKLDRRKLKDSRPALEYR